MDSLSKSPGENAGSDAVSVEDARERLFRSARDQEERDRIHRAFFLAGAPIPRANTQVGIRMVLALVAISFVLGWGFDKVRSDSDREVALKAAAAACADIRACIKLATRYNWGNDVQQYLPSPSR